MPELLKPPINLEEELNQALDENDSNLKLADVKIYLRSAYKSFVTKITVVELLTSLFAIVVFNFIRPYIPTNINTWIIRGFALLFLIIVVVVIVRANSGLIRVAKKLADRNATYRLNEKRHLAQISSLLEQRKTYKDLFEANSVFYGLAFVTNSYVVTIDIGGKGLIETKLVINAARAGMKAIERYSHVNYEELTDKFVLDLQPKEFILEQGEYFLLTPEVINNSPSKVDWLLSAEPEFPVNIPLDYTYSEITPDKAFLMNSDEFDKSDNQYEWFSQKISYPTKKLFIKVIFPKGYRPQKPDVAVWLTDKVKHMNQLEYKRITEIEDGWTVKKYRDIVTLSLEVEFPITGLHYAITWLPMLDWNK